MEPKFTPGPWAVGMGGTDQNPSFSIESQYGAGYVCQTLAGNDEANAHLIAAAPELYGVLHCIYTKHGASFGPEDTAAILNVLDKVKGET